METDLARYETKAKQSLQHVNAVHQRHQTSLR